MNVQPVSDQHPATDDQELAKVLAGVDSQVSQLPTTDDAPQPAEPAGGSGLQFEETPLSQGTAAAADTTAQEPPAAATEPAAPAAAPTAITPEPTVAPSVPVTTASPELESLKKDALEELRPLVTQLDLPADEKFDTLLLIIRSTDDQSLLTAAHEAAKAIADEKKRAEALLDIIKEIDYFGSKTA